MDLNYFFMPSLVKSVCSTEKKLKKQNTAIYWLVGIVCLLFSTYSLASTITVSTEHVDEINYLPASEGSNNDLLHVRQANSAGISYNRFDQFSITDKPLKLVNVARVSDGSEDAAQLIVIMADNIDLRQSIEIVGPASDILFISTASSGVIDCTNCAINNAHRITLATAVPSQTIDDNSSSIGQLSTTSSTISINNLLAPGALALDVMADVIDISGEVSLNQRVNRNTLGGYEQNLNGQYTLGTGGVNVLLGALEWHYEQQEVIRTHPQDQNRTIAGSISAVAFKATSSESLNVTASIVTPTDYLSTVRYLGQTHVTNESITLQSLGGGLTLSGYFETAGAMSAKSYAGLSLTSNAKLNSNNVVLISKGGLLNLAEINADNIAVAAKNIINRGHVNSLVNTEMWAENNIINEFGGLILSETITLQAQNGLVRNGSRYPYLTTIAANEQVSFLDYGEHTLDPSDSTHIGTFYNNNLTVDTQNVGNVLTQPNETVAFIQGQNVNIKAPALENINPYWENVIENADTIDLDLNLVNQVTISGEYQLNIIADNYLVNSSAVIRVNKASGRLGIAAGTVNNERYRTVISLEKSYISSEYSEIEAILGGSNIAYTTQAYIYSPPGLLVSMGRLELTANTGFLNNTAYLEIFGDAFFNAAHINDIGVENNGISQKTSARLCSFGPIDVNGNISSHCPNASVSQTITESVELDSLFFVHGSVYGDAAALAVRNHNPFEYYGKLAARDSFAQQVNGMPDAWLDCVADADSCDTYVYHEEPIPFLLYPDEIYTDATEQDFSSSLTLLDDGNAEVVFEYDLNLRNSETGQWELLASATYDVIIDLFVEVERLYNELTQYISDLFAEFDWWN